MIKLANGDIKGRLRIPAAPEPNNSAFDVSAAPIKDRKIVSQKLSTLLTACLQVR